MTSARRQGNGRADATSIKKVREICKDSTDEDVQAALAEHNGDVQAAVMSLLDNPFQPVEKRKRRPQKPAEREERSSNRDFPYRDNDRRGHDRSRGGRGRGERDRPYDADGPPARGRGRGGRGRGRGPAREKETLQTAVEVTSVENDFGSEVPAYSPAPVEESPPPSAPRVQPQSGPPRMVPSAVVSDGSVSWASKVKERAAPVQQIYEQPESANEFEDRAYHDASSDARAAPPANGMSSEPLEAEPAPAPGLPAPQSDSFGSGYGHEAQGSAWENAHGSAQQTTAWSTSAAASPELPLREHLEEPQSQPPQRQSYDQPAGLPVNSQAFSESKPFDLRDLGASLPASSTVPDDSKPSDYFEIPSQETTSQPPGFGPPGLQQNSPLAMFSNRGRPTAPPAADSTGIGSGVGSESRDAASLISSSFPDFGHSMAPVSMPPSAGPVQHHGTAPQQPQPHHTHSQPPASQQPQQSQDLASTPPQPPPQNQQEPSAQQPPAAQLQPEPHAQHAHSFEPHFPGHAAPESHRSAAAKVSSSAPMFMSEHGPGDRLADGPQSQAGPQSSQDQDKQYVAGESKVQNTSSDQQHQHVPGQAYQQLPPDVNSWGMPAIQPDLYSMQRPGSAQLTPPGMQGMVPGMGQMPNQMQAQYPMNPNMPAPGYGAPGYPTPNYPQQLGYAPPYMQPGYNMQYANSGYYGQMAPQAYAPSPSGPQMYGGPSGSFGKGGGYMGDYNARGAPAGGAGGVPGAGSGRGRGRGKNQKGRMPPSFSPQGGMHTDPYNPNQGAYMDPGWMAQNQRYDGGFKESKGGQPQYPPPFGPGGYDNPPGAYGYGGQFPQHSQFQQSWNSQDKGVGGSKGNF